MLRKMKKIITDFICCRVKKSTIVIALLGSIFVIGNLFLLKTFYSGPSPENGVPIVWTFLTERNVESTQRTLTDIKLPEKKILPPDEPKMSSSEAFRNINDVTIPKLVIETSNKETTKTKQYQYKIGVLVIACNRPAVGRCLDRILKYKPTGVYVPIIVSQDCGHEATANVIKSYGNKVTHIQQPDLGDVQNVPPNMRRWMGYYKISRHFKFALGKVFSDWSVDSVIIIEDDIDIAPDFFDYFLATRPLLDQDKSIYCISAWNDNGKTDLIEQSAIDLLYRSDFFPGLGWLMTRDLWEEFGPKWPLGFWDDWVRAPEQRRDRVCIRPEISRTKTFGRIGVSLGQFFDQYLKYIKLNTEPYPFQDYDLTYLLQEKYDPQFTEVAYNSREIQPDVIMSPNDNPSDETVKITYHGNGELEMLMRKFSLMTDFKAGVARTAYKGIVTFYKNNRRVFLVPPNEWTGYENRRK